MKIKSIIPAAGFGTRMLCKPDESKEMLIEPSTGRPVIQWSLDLCKNLNLVPHIITRKEKLDLLNYVDINQVQIIEPKGEWSNTILESKEYWDDFNILILPDTRWNNVIESITKVKKHLSLGSQIVLGIHTVSDPEKWGIIQDYTILEKPKNSHSNNAWGVIGFTKEVGWELFYDLEKFKTYRLKDTSFVDLVNFRDITRTGKLE